jgi:hypothetical protein
MRESVTLLAAAMQQLRPVEERCLLLEKTPSSEVYPRASPARWFEPRDQQPAGSELPQAAQVMNSGPHAKPLNSLTHAEASNSMALRAGGYSLFWPGSTWKVTTSLDWPRGLASTWIDRPQG